MKHFKRFVQKNEMSASSIFLVVVVAIILLSVVSGIRPCAVMSGSMEPNLPTWSLCFINTRVSYDSIQIGDIVVYQRHSDSTRIIHRVISIEADGMVTKGDANPVSDGLSVGRDNLYGKNLFHIPYLGYCIKVAQQPIVRLAIIVCIAAIITIDIVDTHKSRRKSKYGNKLQEF